MNFLFNHLFWLFIIILISIIIYLSFKLIDKNIINVYAENSLNYSQIVINDLTIIINYDWGGMSKDEVLNKLYKIIEDHPNKALFINEESANLIAFNGVLFKFENNLLIEVSTQW